MRFAIAAAVAALLATSVALSAGAADQPAAKAPTPAPAAVSPAAHPLTQEDVAAWADGLIPYAIHEGDIAGAVVVVVKDGQVLFERGYGYADIATHKPVDPQTTLFRPGSITKTFTWTAVMQLKEQGKLDLDTDVNQYLDFKIPPRDGPPITLRNLMTHTAGFEEKLKYIMATRQTMSLKTYLTNWIPKREFAAGTVPAYSNYGAALAGYIVQRVSGEQYGDYIQHHILDPLAMAHSTTQQPMPPAFAAAVSTGYRQASQPPGYLEFVMPAPAGDLAATGEDMGHFMIAHLQNGAYGNARILKTETAIEMHSPQHKFYPALNAMDLGFYENSRNGHRVIAHDGGTQFFLSDMHMFLDDNVGIFISLNSDGKDGAAPAIHDAFFHGFADRYFPATQPPAASTVDKATALKDARLMAAHPWESTRASFTSFLSLLGLIGPTNFKANPDGTLSTATGTTHLREIQPFVWRNPKSGELLQAVTHDGVPVMIGAGQAPPAALVPTPAWRSPTWLMPAVLAALGVLLLSGLFWPIRALTRRFYGAQFALAGKAALAYRGTRAFALAAVVAFAAFPVLMTWMLGDIGKRLTDATNGLVLSFEGFALIAFVGAAVFALWDAWNAWTGGRGWGSKLWTTLTAVSAVLVLWVGWVFHLIVLNTNY